MIKIGLDTSCLNTKGNNQILNALESLEAQGKVTLVTSTVNEKEQDQSNSNEYWKQKYLKKINQKNKIYEVARLDISRIGEAVIGDDEKCTALEDLFPDKKDFYDLWLIQTCVIGECDYFLTLNSKDFIDDGKREALEDIGIKARIPDDDFLKEIQHLTLIRPPDVKGNK